MCLFDFMTLVERQEVGREKASVIRDACFEVYNTLSSGFLGTVCQEALAFEFQNAGIPRGEIKIQRVVR